MGDEVQPAQPERNMGGLYSLERKLSCHKHLSDLDISNGLAWSADTRTLYHIDTIPRKISAYDFDIHEGRISKWNDFQRILSISMVASLLFSA